MTISGGPPPPNYHPPQPSQARFQNLPGRSSPWCPYRPFSPCPYPISLSEPQSPICATPPIVTHRPWPDSPQSARLRRCQPPTPSRVACAAIRDQPRPHFKKIRRQRPVAPGRAGPLTRTTRRARRPRPHRHQHSFSPSSRSSPYRPIVTHSPWLFRTDLAKLRDAAIPTTRPHRLRDLLPHSIPRHHARLLRRD